MTLQHRRIAGTSLEPVLPSQHGNIAGGRGNDLGYGKNALGLDNPQPSSYVPFAGHTEKVQRLGGDGFSLAESLRYSPIPVERRVLSEGL